MLEPALDRFVAGVPGIVGRFGPGGIANGIF
jgi:hypothetical protein